MKSVMISIKPKWCELIASGKKTVEVRKTRPKIETPFKCYIYETQGRYDDMKECKTFRFWESRQRVIGEFICDFYETIAFSNSKDKIGFEDCVSEYLTNDACLTKRQVFEYANGKPLYGWHISDLVIYDKPKEISEFYKEDFDEVFSNWEDLFSIGLPTGCRVEYPPEPKREDYILKRPFQNWGYVEELEQ